MPCIEWSMCFTLMRCDLGSVMALNERANTRWSMCNITFCIIIMPNHLYVCVRVRVRVRVCNICLLILFVVILWWWWLLWLLLVVLVQRQIHFSHSIIIMYYYYRTRILCTLSIRCLSTSSIWIFSFSMRQHFFVAFTIRMPDPSSRRTILVAAAAVPLCELKRNKMYFIYILATCKHFYLFWYLLGR